jgi:hypothetical protein
VILFRSRNPLFDSTSGFGPLQPAYDGRPPTKMVRQSYYTIQGSGFSYSNLGCGALRRNLGLQPLHQANGFCTGRKRGGSHDRSTVIRLQQAGRVAHAAP